MNAFETSEKKSFVKSKSQIWYAQVLGNEEQLAKDPNAFSYNALVTNWDECQKTFTFPQKSTLKRFNKLSDMVFFNELLNSNDVKKEKNKSKIWHVFMIWLTYGTKYDQILHKKVQDIRFATSFTDLIFSFSFFQLSNIRPHVATTLDFLVDYFINLEQEYNTKFIEIKELYEQHEEQHKRNKLNEMCLEEANFRIKFGEDFDQLRDFLFFSNNNNEPINLLSITTKTTFKSIKTKIKNWHDEVLLNALNDLNSSENEKYPHLLLKSHQVNSSTITPLCDSHSIKREGIDMNHCVASFEKEVKHGKYIVFTVERFDERATLGVHLSFGEPSIPCFTFSQCYKSSNKKVSDKLLLDTQEFIRRINLNPEIIVHLDLLGKFYVIDL